MKPMATLANEFPDCCLRGLRKKDHITQGIASTEAFLPDPRTATERGDGWAETSINWEDDSNACAFTLSRREQAEHGALRLKREVIDRLEQKTPNSLNKVRYVRSRTNDNPYHGDILFDTAHPKHAQKMIAAALALESQFIPPRQSEPT